MSRVLDMTDEEGILVVNTLGGLGYFWLNPPHGMRHDGVA
jgi:hypothetical protein